jgi:hypothetical protein
LTDFDLVIAAPSRIGAGQLGPLDLQLFRYAAPGRQTLRAFSVLPAPSTRLICTIAFPGLGLGYSFEPLPSSVAMPLRPPQR